VKAEKPPLVDILIVDDREENLLVLQAVLSCPEYHLVPANSGREALEHIKVRDFALVLLDVQMPGIDGFETARLIRKGARGADTPIIFLTAINQEERNIHAGYDVGAVDYLFKPFDTVVLRSKVAVFADLHRKEKKIREQEALLKAAYERSDTRFRAFFDQSSLAMQIFDLEGQCVKVNEAWESLLGLNKTQLDDYNIRKDPQLQASGMAHAIESGYAGQACEIPPFLYDPLETGHSGKPTWVATSVFPVKDGTGKVRELALIEKNVTEQMQARKKVEESEQRFRTLADQLEKAVHARDEFLSIASHELRTPITSMLLSNQMLKRQMERNALEAFTPDRLRKMVIQSERQLERLTRLIEDMLDISRINTGRFTLKKERVDLAVLVEDTVERIQPQLTAANCTVLLDLAAGVETLCDRFRVEQALTNLLINALRYAPGKPVRVTLERIQSQCRIAVHDQGTGIQPQDLKRIFGRFERAISVNEVSGLGLGLFIVTQIMEAHGGTASVASVPNEGATFILDLPLTQTQPIE
jgi:PAS domain S-box-containing protein